MTNLFWAHETSVIEAGSMIGSGTRIWHFSHVMPHAQIGEDCTIGQNVFIANYVRIGNRVKIQNNVSVFEGVILEDDVFCGPSCVFTNVKYPRAFVSQKHSFQSTNIRKGVTLGANSTILCGVTIGQYAFIGAGAVVTKNVPDFALMVGAPARHVGWVGERGHPLIHQLETGYWECPLTNKTYFFPDLADSSNS